MHRQSTSALIDRAHAKANQQQDHAELKHLRRDRWHFSPRHHEKASSDEQRQCVSQSPPRAEPRGFRGAALTGHEGCYRSEMIRLERVPDAEQRAQTSARRKSHRWKCDPFARGDSRILKNPVHANRARKPKEKPARCGRGRRLRVRQADREECFDMHRPRLPCV